MAQQDGPERLGPQNRKETRDTKEELAKLKELSEEECRKIVEDAIQELSSLELNGKRVDVGRERNSSTSIYVMWDRRHQVNGSYDRLRGTMTVISYSPDKRVSIPVTEDLPKRLKEEFATMFREQMLYGKRMDFLRGETETAEKALKAQKIKVYVRREDFSIEISRGFSSLSLDVRYPITFGEGTTVTAMSLPDGTAVNLRGQRVADVLIRSATQQIGACMRKEYGSLGLAIDVEDPGVKPQWVREVMKAGARITSLSAAQDLHRKLHAVSWSEEEQIACFRILNGVHIPLAEMNGRDIARIEDFLKNVVVNADPSMEKKLMFISREGVMDILPRIRNLPPECLRSFFTITLPYLLAREETFDLRSFVMDPAFRHIIEAERFVPPAGRTEIPDIVLLVGRNLFMKGSGVTAETVRGAMEEIRELRRGLGDIVILGKGQSATLIANDHYFAGRLQRFGLPGLLRKIRMTGTELRDDIRSHTFSGMTERQLKEEYAKAKEQALKAIRTTPPPHRFIFDGHGGPEAFFLSGGQIGQHLVTGKHLPNAISDEEFATALRERYEAFKGKPEDLRRDVFLFNACFANTMVRTIDTALAGTPYRPIFITTGEYGQSVPNDVMKVGGDTETGQKIFATVMNLRSENPGEVRLRDIFARERLSDGNVSVFVPRTDRATGRVRLEQISRTERQGENRTIAG